MKLTPLDIRHKEFKRGMRGYADVEVDEFLDQVADEYERLFKENIDLQERVESLEDKVAGYKRIEDTLQKTLVNAQASAEEQKQNANKQAQLVLQDAELKARQLVNEAYSERQAIEQSMAKLRSAEEDFRFKFGQLLDGYLRQLKETPEVATTPRQAPDFSRHAEAIKEAIARESVPERPEGAAAPPRVDEPEAAAAEQPAEKAAPEESRAAEPADEPAPASPAPDAFRRPAAADGPPLAPARGHGGVQAGVPPRRQDDTPKPDDTRQAADDPEVTAATPAPGPDDAAADAGGEDRVRRRERILFGESDDLLSDVDTGVNENEFKW
jgi:cell division initiation protein